MLNSQQHRCNMKLVKLPIYTSHIHCLYIRHTFTAYIYVTHSLKREHEATVTVAYVCVWAGGGQGEEVIHHNTVSSKHWHHALILEGLFWLLKVFIEFTDAFVYCYLCTAICVLLFVYCYLCTAICVLLFVYCYLCTAICVLLFVYCYLCTAVCVLLFLYDSCKCYIFHTKLLGDFQQ